MSQPHRAFRTKGSIRVFDTMPALSKIFVQSQAICDSAKKEKGCVESFISTHPVIYQLALKVQRPSASESITH